MTPNQPAPTVGRIVHYHPRLEDVVIVGGAAPSGPYAALVTAVWDDGALALCVHRPGPDPILSLDYVLHGERQGCWSWPPREPAAPAPVEGELRPTSEPRQRLEDTAPGLLVALVLLGGDYGTAGVARVARELERVGIATLEQLAAITPEATA